MSRAVQMKGLAELNAVLDALPKNMKRNAINAGLRAGAKILQDEARARVRKRSGKVARSIKLSSPRVSEDGNSFTIRVQLSERKGDAGYVGWFLEYGTRPHLIARKQARVGPAGLKAKLAKGETIKGALKIGDRYVSGVISHPGAKASPFLAPAFDAKADDALKAFAGAVAAFVEGKTGYQAPIEREAA